MRSKKIKHIFEYILFLYILFITWILPELWVVKLGGLVGRLMHRLGLRKKVVMKNLEIAFGDEKSLEEREEICRKSYINMGITIFEVILMFHMPKNKFHKYLEFTGQDVVEEALKEGKGVVISSAHFCNWEYMPTGVPALVHPMYGYTGGQTNKFFDDALVKNREKFGLKAIRKSKMAFQEMVQAVQGKNMLGLIGDLNMPDSDMFVDFFGKKAATGAGIGILPVKMGTPILFGWDLRVAPLKHKGTLCRIDFTPTGDTRKDAQTVAQKIHDHLEAIIRQYPENYWWVHKRWKSRPPEEKGVDLYK